MITQSMLVELEGSMLRSFTRTKNSITPLSRRENNFLGTTKFREEFIKEFMKNLQERRPVLQREIVKGGYKDFSRLGDSVYRKIEDKIRSELSTRLMSRKELDDAAFQKLIRDIKVEIRDIFYENYFSK